CVWFFSQAEDGIRYRNVTGVQTCALPISHDQADIFGEPYAVYNQPPLRNALMLVPEADRFTYIYRCQRQAIDHAFVTPGLWHKVNRAAISRGNAGRYDALYASKGEFVVSDHDGIAVYVQQPTD